MSDKKSTMQVFFRFDEYGRNAINATCGGETNKCPVIKFVDVCKMEHFVVHQEPCKIRVIRIVPMATGKITESVKNIANHLCENCKHRQR